MTHEKEAKSAHKKCRKQEVKLATKRLYTKGYQLFIKKQIATNAINFRFSASTLKEKSFFFRSCPIKNISQLL